MADAALISLSVPASVSPGETFTITATITNTGNTNWPAGGTQPVKLTSGPDNNTTWGWNRASLTGDVPPGQSATVSVTAVAPAVPGTYTILTQMVREFVAFFNAPKSQSITVAGSPSPPVPPSPPSPPVPPSPPPVSPGVFFVMPPTRPDPADLVSAMVFNTGAYPGDGVWHSLFWKNETGKRLRVHKAYLWTGVDLGGRHDVHVQVRRCEGPDPTKPETDPYYGLNPSALLGMLQWDHYAEPTLPAGVVWDFSPVILIEPNEYLWMLCMSKTNPQNAHHVFEMWFTPETVG